MARNNDRDRDRGSKRVLKDNRPRGKKKVCIFCKEHATWVDYKDVNLLKRFMSDRGKIRSRRVTGNCAQHQRDVQVAIKTAREVALLPYTQRTVSERGPGRGPRGPRLEGAEPQLANGDADIDELDDAGQHEDEAEQTEREEVNA
ncbi:MAG: 30S ribosomal protein S18 [Acidimicrobiales bacterium]|nr:30S ribosomal protein S18 [Acidimicrobiales bacterium]